MKQPFYLLLFCLLAQSVCAQSPYIPLNQDYYHLIDRFEIRQGQWANGFHSSLKPYNRQGVIDLVDSVEANPNYQLSDTDYFNLNYLRDDSWEWSKANPTEPDSINQAKPGDSKRKLGVFYHKKADAYSVQTADFDLHFNPVFNYGFGRENNTSDQLYVNTRGLEMRGSIGKRLGFYTYFSDNQALFPRYIQEYGQIYGRGSTTSFAPGEGLVKYTNADQKTGADFISARGYITFNALKIINIQFGHDRNFIGNGYRSLLLSDNSAPYLFLKLTTRFGRFQYMNLFAELQNTQVPTQGEQLIPQKFTAMHHLSMNLGKHINLGVFEAEMFSRDRPDLNYLNPIIFYRYIESFRGSQDNAFIGIDFKASFKNHFLFYSQLMIDEFLYKALVQGKGSWTNKYAVQAGLKYIDAFGVSNLDLQTELNLARPYTYSHQGPTLVVDSTSQGQTNYVHYNQPLAHPLGANFLEGLAIVRYQYKRLSATGTFGLMKYGTDPPGRNYGGNILLDYRTRYRDEGNYIGQGQKTLTTYADMRVSYMFKHNLFLDARYLYRFQDSEYIPNSYVTRLGSIALRWNLAYRNSTF